MVEKTVLSTKFHENWMAKAPAIEQLSQGAKDELEGSLTSLNWLQGLNMSLNANKQVSLIQSNTDQGMTVNHIQQPALTSELASHGVGRTSIERVDYKSNPFVKPPFSYVQLICMAMQECGGKKVTLSQIYSWIMENMIYYTMADPCWQNSIRHNLSLNKCFEKVPRKKGDPGKGGYWRMNPNYDPATLESTIIITPKRQSPPAKDSNTSPSKKRIKLEDDNDLNIGQFVEANIGTVNTTSKPELVKLPDCSSLLTPLTPEQSEVDTDDIDEILNNFTNSNFDSTQLEYSDTNQHLDLSIQGTRIEPPSWWGESFNGAFGRSPYVVDADGLADSSDLQNKELHPWSASNIDIDQAMAALSDFENFLT